MLSTLLVALIAAPLRGQSAAFYPATASPSELTMVDLFVQPMIASQFTIPIITSPELREARSNSSPQLLSRSTALSYTIDEELFGSSDRGRNTLKGALIGGTVGFVLGAIGGTQIGTGCETTTTSRCNARRNMILGVGGLGAGLGVLIGAGIGALR